MNSRIIKVEQFYPTFVLPSLLTLTVVVDEDNGGDHDKSLTLWWL
jgi:hypothetical protein